METIFETYARTVCANCKNRKECKEELRQRIDGTLYCEPYEREKRPEKKKKQYMDITAKQLKPIMRRLV